MATKYVRKNQGRYVSNGCYTGLAVQDYDVDAYAEKVYRAPGLNFSVIHGSTAWDNPLMRFFCPLENGKYNVKKKDQDYFDHIEAFMMAHAKRKLGVHFKFFDQYNHVKWLSSAWKTCDKHIFRDNTAGVRWETEVPLYYNWNHKSAADPRNFSWFFFRTDDKDNLIYWKPTNALGEAMIYIYFDGIMDIVDKVFAEYPDFLFRYGGFNESILFTKDNVWQHDRGRDVDERSLRLLRDLWLKRGYQQRTNFREHIDVRFEEMGAGLNLNRHKQYERILKGEVKTEASDKGPVAVTFSDVNQEMVEDQENTPGIFRYALSTSVETAFANAPMPMPTDDEYADPDSFSMELAEGAEPAPMVAVDPTPDLPRIVEIHGYDNGSECTEEIHKLDLKMTHVSSDGAKEDPTYYQRMQQIWKHGTGHRHIDFKMVPLGSWEKPSTWNSKKIMVNVANALKPSAMGKIFQ